jgi:predicted transcriptional regulator
MLYPMETFLIYKSFAYKMVGNKTNFEEEDIIRTFLLIKERPVSRAELVEKIGLGEGSIRTILDILKGRELLDSDNKGHYLSTKGKEKQKEIKKEFAELKKLELQEYKGLKSCGLLIKNHKRKKITIDLRDEAIRNGSYSAILFQYEKEGLNIPLIEFDYKTENPKDYEELMKNFSFEKGDLLIVTFAKDYKTCENSAIAVAKKVKEIEL